MNDVCLIHRGKHKLCESHTNGHHFIWQNPALFTQDRLVWRQAVQRPPLSRFFVCRITLELVQGTAFHTKFLHQV